ncbi:MAG: F0F1 ATP synthase subunit B [Pseudonocardiales bacterium]
MPSVVLAADSNFLIPNGTFLVELIAFLVILAVIGRLVIPPVQTAVRQRRELISGQFAEARQARERAQAAEAAYHKAMNDARAEAAAIRESARAQGQQIIDELREDAQAQADRITAEGREQLDASRDALVRELRAEVGALAVELAGRVVGESLADEARRTHTVQEFLDGLEQRSEHPAASSGGQR